MRKILILVFASATILWGCDNMNGAKSESADGEEGQAEQNEATQAASTTTTKMEAVPASGKFAYVEIDSLTQHYKFLIDKGLALEQMRTKAENELRQKERTLQQHANELQKKYESEGFTTKSELDEAQSKLAREQQALAQREQVLTLELAAEQEKVNKELRDSIQSFLRSYNASRRFDFIFSKAGDNILLANPALDITDEVIEGLNKRYSRK